uniref:UPF0518 protein v1g243165 n=2 Tax=Cacopsylla melanoneura TaxID=428564 RepID=A0A8D8VMM9_9HEMI
MGLLTDPATGEGVFAHSLLRYSNKTSFLLYVLGVIWFALLAHDDITIGTHFSENALLPGLVKGDYSEDEIARGFLTELTNEMQNSSGQMPVPYLMARFHQLGLEGYIHNFTLHYPLGKPTENDCPASVSHADQYTQWTTDDELVVATAYLELFVRSVSHPGVLHSFVKFILTATYENKRVVDCLIQRINSSYRLSLVTLALIETLIDSNCEDIILALVLRPLIPCSHIMLSQRTRLTHVDPFAKSAHKFLTLIPQLGESEDGVTSQGDSAGFYSNYYAYLHEARVRIEACYRATTVWTYPYDGESPPHCELSEVRQLDELSKIASVLDGETELTSLPSADDGSSGYESFKNSDHSSPHGEEGEGWSERGKLSPSHPQPPGVMNMMTSGSPSIGPFLDTLFIKLESLPSQDLSTNLLVTSIISRLAIYPQPLIHSLLLDHSLVFQPSIRSLFQILSSLKTKLESQLRNEKNLPKLRKEAERLLLEREDRLTVPRLNSGSQSLGTTSSSPSAFERFDSKRKSFSDTIGGLFKRSKEPQLESCSQGYRFINRSTAETSKKTRRAVLCAILLSEWLKELAAITQEHTVCYLNVDDSS